MLKNLEIYKQYLKGSKNAKTKEKAIERKRMIAWKKGRNIAGEENTRKKFFMRKKKEKDYRKNRNKKKELSDRKKNNSIFMSR